MWTTARKAGSLPQIRAAAPEFSEDVLPAGGASELALGGSGAQQRAQVIASVQSLFGYARQEQPGSGRSGSDKRPGTGPAGQHFLLSGQQPGRDGMAERGLRGSGQPGRGDPAVARCPCAYLPDQ
jgi:hypothetical protein